RRGLARRIANALVGRAWPILPTRDAVAILHERRTSCDFRYRPCYEPAMPFEVLRRFAPGSNARVQFRTRRRGFTLPLSAVILDRSCRGLAAAVTRRLLECMARACVFR